MAPEDHAKLTGLLAGKSILVVGASTGIGADSARLFAREGASVMLAARSEDTLRALADELTGAGHEAAYVVGDVAVAADVARFVNETVARFGCLDGAFNNAAITQGGRLDEVTEADFDRIMDVNVKGVWLCLREQARVMRAAGAGAIVNVSSVGGLRGSPGFGAYQATKHAVIGLTRTAAHDNGPVGVRVNAVAPGPVLTSMLVKTDGVIPDGVKARIASTPLRKAAETSEVAESAAWLLSDRASHISGVVLPVDGGFTA
ncbi:2,5-dichloro-2,5-cyclohexadiene-1,4-diol dehydrogenase [Microbacterium faecale]|uniref:2,5-dichloro-2,5-cyclohexadiene-1,4-diol dehydrogenase n=1 Tax=Microbacterium faecale TaxID=1804630 RepID=A0A917DCT6_9MICO|nr:SDR family NAD(P)-dependent oxidoreductase [Microbacterium faecale]GGD27401.1 2,5-dichloro-2,5-cyclohexadiene-1,4-diol dehydrogenase [Microbacterium faecale]